MKQQLIDIATMVKELVGVEGVVYFDSELKVKRCPHDDNPVHLWAVSVSDVGNVWVMDANQDWYKLDEADTLVIPSLFQRISIIKSTYKKAV